MQKRDDEMSDGAVSTGRTHTSRAEWLRLLGRLGLTDPDLATYARLKKAYGAPSRHYHSLNHIDDCLTQLQRCHKLTDQLDEMALAFWFHDAVYHWNRSTNEEESADWAADFLVENEAPRSLVDQVTQLILATRHFEPETPTQNSALFVDIDLSILGRSPKIYQRYEQAIAREYERVPRVFYRRGRRSVLQSFLERDWIFQSERFRALYENQARHNINAALRTI